MNNKSKACFYKKNADGFHTVNYDGVEVANDLTWMQAARLCDDLSYYGQAINCAYNENVVCKQVETKCKSCHYKFLHKAKE